ncbi:OLC1v1031064C1 [Oldenlandia corymbosa var. corymbosa]|uniref:OLC1v1031064C1 n=1 Tax=Oldenlandia corymbosa var. corymbosa TaxID=529605 RepID=A0AAV1CID6_OLDCO|nr:OLC1v1031064C1 [Oldenlandia corymbosa var. corymbosa]
MSAKMSSPIPSQSRSSSQMPSPIAKVDDAATVTATANGMTSSDGGSSTYTSARLLFDLNQLQDMELRLGWALTRKRVHCPQRSAFVHSGEFVCYLRFDLI